MNKTFLGSSTHRGIKSCTVFAQQEACKTCKPETCGHDRIAEEITASNGQQLVFSST